MNKNLIYISFGLILGVISAFLPFALLHNIAEETSEIFIRFLKLICTPIIFLSIISTISGMKNIKEMKFFGLKTFKYTIFTTIIAAAIGLLLFESIQPSTVEASAVEAVQNNLSYFDAVKQIIPDNIFKAFSENNVTGIAFLAFILGIAALGLPKNQQETIHSFFSAFFTIFLRITGFIIKIMPIAIWSFTTLFVLEVFKGNFNIRAIASYVICVVLANLIQGVIVLPIILKRKKISPIALFKSMSEALVIAFFSKSSSAALPVTIRCAEEKFKIPRKISNFTFPLCSVINMNACASFILITVLFVGSEAGIAFSFYSKLGWILLASIAAIGNAGVPMGCYFLATAFLSGIGSPLHLMGIILPVYAFLDMLETAINVWSDSCITAIVAKDLEEKKVSQANYVEHSLDESLI